MRRKNKGVNITFSLYLARRRPHVGAAPPAKPYPTVGPRQQGAPNPTRRRPMLAPPRRQSLNPPSGHANRAPRIPLAAGPCWRRPADNPLSHRRARQQGVLFPRRAPLPGGPAPLPPKVPLFPAGLHLFPVGPLPAGGSAAPFKSKFSRDNRHKKRKISPLQQFQPKIKIVSIKKSRAFWGKY